MLGWNLFLLGVIAFMPFATAFLAENALGGVPDRCRIQVIVQMKNDQDSDDGPAGRRLAGDPSATPQFVVSCRKRFVYSPTARHPLFGSTSIWPPSGWSTAVRR